MLIPQFFAGICSAGLTVLGADVALSQDFPNKPYASWSARLVVQRYHGAHHRAGDFSHLGQQVIVDNRGRQSAGRNGRESTARWLHPAHRRRHLLDRSAVAESALRCGAGLFPDFNYDNVGQCSCRASVVAVKSVKT